MTKIKSKEYFSITQTRLFTPSNKNTGADNISFLSKRQRAKIYSTRDGVNIGATGDTNIIVSTGELVRIGNFGDYSRIESQGNFSKVGCTGYRTQVEVTGENTIASVIGHNSIVKGKLGTWITLAEYDGDYKPTCVKSGLIDNKLLKENVYYILKNGEFVEWKAEQ